MLLLLGVPLIDGWSRVLSCNMPLVVVKGGRVSHLLYLRLGVCRAMKTFHLGFTIKARLSRHGNASNLLICC